MGFIKDVTDYIIDNKRHVLTGASMATAIYSGISWCRAGVKIKPIIDRCKDDLDDCYEDDNEAKRAVVFETVKDIAPKIIGPAILTAGTCGMIFANDRITSKELAVISAAYILSENKRETFKKQVRKMFGEDEVKKAEAEGAKEQLHEYNMQHPNETINNYVRTGYGNTRAIDFPSNQKFLTSPSHIDRVITNLSEKVKSEMWIPINWFFMDLGLKRMELAEDLGWGVNNLIGGDGPNGRLPITYHAVLDDDKEPILCLEYDVFIKRDYYGDLDAR